MLTNEPTPCANDGRWLSTNPEDIAHALNGCLGCPALYQPHDTLGGTSCTELRADLIANEPHFPDFEGVIAGEVHDPMADRRAERRARRAERQRSTPAPGYSANFAAANAARWNATHCKRGHEFDEENTYVDPKGNRTCRACVRASRAAYRERNKPNKPPTGPAACVHGHNFTTENTYITKEGRRRCRECRRISQRASDLRRKNRNAQPTTRRDDAA